MTNEEKASEIASDVCGFTPSIEKWDITGEWGCAEDAALKMAEWKDQQFKECMEKMREEHIRKCLECTDISQYNIREYHSVRVGVFNEIINKFFKED